MTGKTGFFTCNSQLPHVQDKLSTFPPPKKRRSPEDGNSGRFLFFKIEIKSQLHGRAGGVQEKERYCREPRGF